MTRGVAYNRQATLEYTSDEQRTVTLLLLKKALLFFGFSLCILYVANTMKTKCVLSLVVLA